jgi:hypothetical protein
MTATTLASYAITGRREIWPLLVVLGLLVVVITGLVIAQLTDPDRTQRAADRRALVAGIASADAASAPTDGKDGTTPAPPGEQRVEPPAVPADVEVPHQDRRTD